MVEPVSLTVLATSIVGFVFTTASTTVVEKATEATLKKINTLGNMVRGRLKSNPQVLTELEKGSDEDKDLETIRFYLESELRQNKDFREEVKRLYDEINQALNNEGKDANITNFYGKNSFQANHNQGTIKNYNAETMTVNEKE
ncbi:hypothetical protein [Crocosphaera sp.]|uniref:hypothetical protein n=1 Tax=Crocosphaera sp. TaxID=2729996 RepID=UPI002614859C|nr:hypothetical protein [Crocosphaera sp.]MDJ0580818.1 hypothetical protein [Crocosphaera sp.]